METYFCWYLIYSHRNISAIPHFLVHHCLQQQNVMISLHHHLINVISPSLYCLSWDEHRNTNVFQFAFIKLLKSFPSCIARIEIAHKAQSKHPHLKKYHADYIVNMINQRIKNWKRLIFVKVLSSISCDTVNSITDSDYVFSIFITL